MTERKPAHGAIAQEMNVSGAAAGVAQVAGSGNTVTATGSVSLATPAEVMQALVAIQAALSLHPVTKALADAAIQEAKSDQPDKAAIGAQLKTAIDVAKTTLGWAELARKLAPHLETAVAWLGASWAAHISL
jgi:hypothetical protein